MIPVGTRVILAKDFPATDLRKGLQGVVVEYRDHLLWVLFDDLAGTRWMNETDLTVVPTFDPRKPVRTRNGTPARIICTDRKGGGPIVALLKQWGTEYESWQTYMDDGRVAGHQGYTPSDYDLVNIPPEPKKVLGQVVMLNDGCTNFRLYSSGPVHPGTQLGARKVVAVVTVEIQEGDDR